MSFGISYDAPEHGWSTVRVTSDRTRAEMTVSYLHDSLYDLTTAASSLLRGAKEATVVFMDEPGEHHLVLRQDEPGRVDFEVRWFDDWASWGMYSPDKFELVLKGSTTASSFTAAVLGVLDGLWSEVGLIEYKKRWVEHDFPVERYEQLKALVAV